MSGDRKDWRKLCELAVKEHDPQKLMQLIEQLTRALAERNEQQKGSDGKSRF